MQRTSLAGPGFMDHPRARVALEERGRILPGCFQPSFRPYGGFSGSAAFGS
jgi:hypothetical protein